MSGSLRRDTALYAAAVLLDRTLGFLLLPLLTRAISPQDYGAWTQTAVTAGLLVPLVVFALPTTIVRYFSGAGAATRRMFDRLGALCLAIFGAVAGFVLAAAGPFATWTYGDAAARSLLPPLLALLAAESAIELAVAWLRAGGRMRAVTGLLMTRSVVRYAAIGALVLSGPAPLADWLGRYAAVQGLLAALALAYSRSRQAALPAAGAAAPPTMHELLRFSAPLVLLAGVTSLNAVLDRYLLLRWLDLPAVAVYAATQSLTTIPMIFYSVLGFTLFPVLARHWAERRHDEAALLMSRSLQVYLFLCIPVALSIALAGPWALPALTTAHYDAGLPVFAWLALAVVAFGVYQILLYALLLDGRSPQILALAIAATAVNALLNLFLVPRFGVSGAAAASAASNLLVAAVAARLARTVLPWRLPWAGLWATVWRAGVALLPLGGLVLLRQPSGLAIAGGLVVAIVVYLGLDLGRPGSIARSVLP